MVSDFQQQLDPSEIYQPLQELDSCLGLFENILENGILPQLTSDTIEHPNPSLQSDSNSYVCIYDAKQDLNLFSTVPKYKGQKYHSYERLCRWQSYLRTGEMYECSNEYRGNI